MKKMDFFATIFALCISTTLLFQNCSAPKSQRSSSVQIQGEEVSPEPTNNESQFPVTPQQPEPNPPQEAVLQNRNLDLDNKVLEGSVSFGSGMGDIYIYETNYLSKNQSTIVRIEDHSTLMALSVLSDQCTGSKMLNINELRTFYNIFRDSFPKTQVKELLPIENEENGCGFPRLTMNAGGQRPDLDLYFSSRACSPEGELYLTAGDQPGSDVNLRNRLLSFFNEQINDVCGL